MRALKLIAASKVKLAKPKNFSNRFCDFIDCCLVKDQNLRPSAKDLLKHPFLLHGKQLPRQLILKELADKVAMIKAKKKAGIVVEADDEKMSEVPSKDIIETIEYATKARSKTSTGLTVLNQMTINPFLIFVEKYLKLDAISIC